MPVPKLQTASTADKRLLAAIRAGLNTPRAVDWLSRDEETADPTRLFQLADEQVLTILRAPKLPLECPNLTSISTNSIGFSEVELRHVRAAFVIGLLPWKLYEMGIYPAAWPKPDHWRQSQKASRSATAKLEAFVEFLGTTEGEQAGAGWDWKRKVWARSLSDTSSYGELKRTATEMLRLRRMVERIPPSVILQECSDRRPPQATKHFINTCLAPSFAEIYGRDPGKSGNHSPDGPWKSSGPFVRFGTAVCQAIGESLESGTVARHLDKDAYREALEPWRATVAVAMG